MAQHEQRLGQSDSARMARTFAFVGSSLRNLRQISDRFWGSFVALSWTSIWPFMAMSLMRLVAPCSWNLRTSETFSASWAFSWSGLKSRIWWNRSRA
jgi:hypothetical protein